MQSADSSTQPDNRPLSQPVSTITLKWASAADEVVNAAETRHQLQVMANRAKIPELPDALFHHGRGEKLKPSIIWRPARGGVCLTAVGATARTTLFQALPNLMASLVDITGEQIDMALPPGTHAGVTLVRRSPVYVARHVLIAKKPGQMQRWKGASEDERRAILHEMIERSLHLQAEAWDLWMPDRIPGLRLLNYATGIGGADVTRSGGSDQKARIVGTRCPSIRFTCGLKLAGPWAIGHGTSKGFGRLREQIRMARAK
ncbi:MAG: hypothetical protein RJQ08_12205 [Salinisphaeraceae bacterium]